LEQYPVKGFAMDDERLKQAGGGNYFDELLARIRDIRSSERLFWKRKRESLAGRLRHLNENTHKQQRDPLSSSPRYAIVKSGG
jgi:hypothetical protein